MKKVTLYNDNACDIFPRNINELYLGNFVNGVGTDNGYTENYNIVCMHDAILIPFMGLRIKFKLPSSLKARVRHGEKIQSMSSVSNWYVDSNEFVFSSTWFYRIEFQKSSGASLSVNEIKQFINDGAIYVEILNKFENNVSSDVSENIKYIRALIPDYKKENTSGIPNPTLNDSVNTVISHISDIHSDYYRTARFYEIANLLNVNINLITGDIIGNTIENGDNYLLNIDNDNTIPTCVCIGNHDCAVAHSEADVYNNTFMKHFAEKYSYTKDGSVCYYYKDIPSQKIRVIALNHYDGGHTEQNGGARHFSQKQVNFFCDALKTTPEGYGVITIQHSPMIGYSQMTNKSSIFSQSNVPLWDDGGQFVFYQIVDAFISRTSISTTLTQNVQLTDEFPSGTYTFNISADFSNVPNSVEFIMHCAGHEHIDMAGYVPNTTNKQLMLTVVCGCCLFAPTTNAYYANLGDLPRDGHDSTQDAFNIYVIDRKNKKVKIGRIGSNINVNMVERKYDILDYS